MKVLGVIALIAIIYAIASNGSSVPTLSPGGANTVYTLPVSDGSNSSIAPLTSATLNPAHGQPGHRCDIKVGQPLNSSPQTPAAKGLTASPFLSSPVSSQARPFVVPGLNPVTGLNPPHGRPGHRCDIKVGAPLNSKSDEVTTTTTTLAPSLNATTTTAMPKLNPEHGQPGHRCSVKVGDPL